MKWLDAVQKRRFPNKLGTHKIGGPMASLYLLKHPDHYTSHKFKPFYWKSYVQEVRSAWTSSDNDTNIVPEKVVIAKKDDEYVAISNVDDYVY